MFYEMIAMICVISFVIASWMQTQADFWRISFAVIKFHYFFFIHKRVSSIWVCECEKKYFIHTSVLLLLLYVKRKIMKMGIEFDLSLSL